MSPLTRFPRGETLLPLLLAALLVMMFVATPLADIGVIRRPLVGMVMVVVVLSGMLASDRAGHLAFPIIGLGLLVLLMLVLGAVAPASWVVVVGDSGAVVFIGLLIAVLLMGVLGAGRITVRRIIGAVAIYLLIGLLFSILFDLLEHLVPGSFAMGPNPAPRATAGSQFFYLSMITLTSVGFGDMAPVHPFARSLVMLEAVVGQIYTTVLLAWLVSLEIVYRRTL